MLDFEDHQKIVTCEVNLIRMMIGSVINEELICLEEQQTLVDEQQFIISSLNSLKSLAIETDYSRINEIFYQQN